MRYCITNSLEIKANFVLQFVLQGPAGYIDKDFLLCILLYVGMQQQLVDLDY